MCQHGWPAGCLPVMEREERAGARERERAIRLFYSNKIILLLMLRPPSHHKCGIAFDARGNSRMRWVPEEIGLHFEELVNY